MAFARDARVSLDPHPDGSTCAHAGHHAARDGGVNGASEGQSTGFMGDRR